MDHPVELLPKEQLPDYSLSQLQPQHLPVSSVIVTMKLTYLSSMVPRSLSAISSIVIQQRRLV